MPDAPEDLGRMLAREIADPGPLPDSGPEFVQWAGGRQAAVRALTDLEASPRRRDYRTEEAWRSDWNRWRTAQRNVQRYDRGRRPLRVGARQRARLRAGALDRRIRLLARHGALAKLYARVAISTPRVGKRPDVRDRVMPADPRPGVRIDGPTMRAVLESIREGDYDAAAEIFLDAFWDAYGMPEAELEHVTSMTVTHLDVEAE